MSTNIRYPNITAADETGQLLQVKSYLHQLVEQLNWALQNTEQITSSGSVVQTGSSSSIAESGEISPATFGEIKSLIIKSADIVNAYYEEINSRLEGIYVAESEFGTFQEWTEGEFTNTSAYIEQVYTSLQTITSEINNQLIEVNAHIKTGLLYEDPETGPVYGLEVGQKTEIDGEEIFNKYARFTANRLSFYDQNDTEVAYISDYKLYITNAEIAGNLTVGGYVMDTTNGIAFKWVGTGGDS